MSVGRWPSRQVAGSLFDLVHHGASDRLPLWSASPRRRLCADCPSRREEGRGQRTLGSSEHLPKTLTLWARAFIHVCHVLVVGSMADEARDKRRERFMKAPVPLTPMTRSSRAAVNAARAAAARLFSPALNIFTFSAFLRAFLSFP